MDTNTASEVVVEPVTQPVTETEQTVESSIEETVKSVVPPEANFKFLLPSPNPVILVICDPPTNVPNLIWG